MTQNISFKEQFYSLCEFLGQDSKNLIQNFGQYDEIDENPDRMFVVYKKNYSFFLIAKNRIENLQIPKIDSFGHSYEPKDEFYTLDGITLGMTKEEVITHWGEPTSKGSYRWTYGHKIITTTNGKKAVLSIDFDEKEEEEYFLSNFNATLIDTPSKTEPKKACFVATACYGEYEAPEVLILRKYRDNVLLKSKFGKLLVKFYYFVSPPFATLIRNSNSTKTFIRKYILEPIILKIKQTMENKIVNNEL